MYPLLMQYKATKSITTIRLALLHMLFLKSRFLCLHLLSCLLRWLQWSLRRMDRPNKYWMPYNTHCLLPQPYIPRTLHLSPKQPQTKQIDRFDTICKSMSRLFLKLLPLAYRLHWQLIPRNPYNYHRHHLHRFGLSCPNSIRHNRRFYSPTQ